MTYTDICDMSSYLTDDSWQDRSNLGRVERGQDILKHQLGNNQLVVTDLAGHTTLQLDL